MAVGGGCFLRCGNGVGAHLALLRGDWLGRTSKRGACGVRARILEGGLSRLGCRAMMGQMPLLAFRMRLILYVS